MAGTVTAVIPLHDGATTCHLVTISYTGFERGIYGATAHQLKLCPKHDRVLYARAKDMARSTGEEYKEVREQMYNRWRDKAVLGAR